MNYKKNYEDYIKYVKKQNREKYKGIYYEDHHIKPRSLGGKDTEANMVLLTPREHFLAHYLLCKIYKEGDDHYKMVCAFNLFILRDESSIKCCNSRIFESKKIDWIKSLKENSTKKFVPKKKYLKKKSRKKENV